MVNKIKYLFAVLAVLFGSTLFYNMVYIPKSTFETISPVVGDLEVKVFGIGNVGAKNIYALNAQTGGKILSILADEGEWVKKGELLVTIDTVDLPELLAEAKISVKKAKSELEATLKELKSLEAQKKLAQVTYKRYAKLKDQSFASQSEYDKAKADLDVIEAQIEATQARIESAKVEIERGSKGVEALETKLSRYRIHAPVDGYVIAKEAEVSESVTPSQTILKIVDPKTVWIKAYIDEKISGDIRLGQKALITLRSQRKIRHSGYVERIVAQTDAVTQEKEVDIAFDKLPIPFYINEQAEVLIATKHFEDVVKIPASVIFYRNGEAGVWVSRDAKAHFQRVGIIARSETEIAVEMLAEDAKIVLAAKNKKPLSEGMSIR
jgi:RND family efflux transporter MFP subunit